MYDTYSRHIYICIYTHMCLYSNNWAPEYPFRTHVKAEVYGLGGCNLGPRCSEAKVFSSGVWRDQVCLLGDMM